MPHNETTPISVESIEGKGSVFSITVQDKTGEEESDAFEQQIQRRVTQQLMDSTLQQSLLN
jgi:hypothetical protein